MCRLNPHVSVPLLSAPPRFHGSLFASIMLAVPSVEGGGAGTKGPQHAGSAIQTAGFVELLT